MRQVRGQGRIDFVGDRARTPTQQLGGEPAPACADLVDEHARVGDGDVGDPAGGQGVGQEVLAVRAAGTGLLPPERRVPEGRVWPEP